MKHIKKMKIDIDKKNHEVISSVQYDNNTRFLHINLVSEGAAFDITGCSIKISATKPDGTAVFNNCKVINAKEGFIEVELTEQINAAPGNVNCEIKIYTANGVLTTKQFYIDVTASATSKEIVSSNELKALTDTLKEVQKFEDKINDLQNHIVGGNMQQEHSHLNKDILDKLTENKGSLFYNGKEIGKKTIDDTIVSNEYSWSSDKISKTMFTKVRTVNLYNKDNAIFDKFINPSGVVTAYSGYTYNEEYIEVSTTGGRVYLSASHNCIIAQYDDNKGLVKQDTFKGNYLETSTKYIRICVKKDFISSFMLVVGRELPTEYTPYYKEILNTNIEVSPSNIKNTNELSKNMKVGKNNLSQELLPTFFMCESIGKFSYVNYDISDLVGGETNVTVSYKIKIHSLANGATTTTINYRLMNDANNGFGIGTVNQEMGEVKTGVGVENKITYNFTLTNTRRYLKVVNWIKDGIATYDIWDVKVTVNGVNVVTYEIGSYTSAAVPVPGTITDLNKNGCSLATIEYLNKVGIAGGGGGSSSNKLKGKKAIFLGDSITFGGTYPATLKLALELLEATKLATNGWTSADLVNNKEKIPADTDVISVWIGINDFIQGRPLGVNTDRDNETFYGSLHTLCSYLAQNFVGKKIGFYTPLHCNHNAFTSPDSLNKQELKVEDYRKVIHEVCSYYSIPVCDLHAVSGIAPYIESHRVLYTSDGLHLNAKGYEKVVPCMIDFLQSL